MHLFFHGTQTKVSVLRLIKKKQNITGISHITLLKMIYFLKNFTLLKTNGSIALADEITH